MPDFFSQVPTDLTANLEYRVAIRKRAAVDIPFRQALLTACKHDVLFWLAAFVWLYEPRPRFDASGRALPKMIPFIPWEHQIPIIRAIRENLGVRDIGVEKSRGEGMSWIGVMMALHDWLFDDLAKVGLVSNTEKKADDPGNMDSLGAKIDWELTKLPRWMAGVKDVDWTRNMSDHSWVNKRNGSQINAFAATSDAGRAGRYKWFMPDELAFWDRGPDAKFINAIRGSTDSRLVISTPNGNDGAYFHFIHTPSNAVRLKLHWSQNISKNRGLYELKGNKPVPLDPVKNPLPKQYDPPSRQVLDMYSRLRTKGFKLEKKLRSPWYDNECDRSDATPFSIAQELDLDYGGSSYRVFGAEFFEKANASVMEPILRGSMDYSRESLEPDFQKASDGPVLLWTQLGHLNKPPERQYSLGADVAAGTGGSYSSNSSIFVMDLVTLEQVCEWATNTTDPGDFAEYCIAFCKFFWNAYLIWESNGPTGSAFTKRVLEKGYSNIYYRTPLTKRGKQRTKEAGWYTTDGTQGTKGIMFSGLRRAVVSDGVKVRSKATVTECGEYVWMNGKIVNIHVASTEDESASGQAHGDRVIAFGVCNQARLDRPVLDVQTEREVSRYSMAGRAAAWEKAQKAKEDAWDDRTNWDMMGRARSRLGMIA